MCEETLTIVEIVVDIIATIATVSAVIIAVWANKQTQQELKQSLIIQEQAKNVDLFDRRVNLLDNIEKDTLISETHLKVLFDNNVINLYNQLEQCKKELLTKAILCAKILKIHFH